MEIIIYMNKKGITPIIAIVILLLIVMALAGSAWLFLGGYASSFTSKVVFIPPGSQSCEDGLVRFSVNNAGDSEIGLVPMPTGWAFSDVENFFGNPGFESTTSDWLGEDSDCDDGYCKYRTNDAEYVIEDSYSWYARGPAGNADVIMMQAVPDSDQPNTEFAMGFEYKCLSDASINGWHMAFRDSNGIGSDIYDTTAKAYIQDIGTGTKDMSNFDCAENENGFVRAELFNTDTGGGTSYNWVVWDNEDSSSEMSMVFDSMYVGPPLPNGCSCTKTSCTCGDLTVIKETGGALYPFFSKNVIEEGESAIFKDAGCFSDSCKYRLITSSGNTASVLVNC